MGNRLLLADDSITIQKVVAIIFANEEFELTVVDNGSAALEKAREVRPDVMLVDALMPGKSGYEVCEEIRRDPQLNTVPILLLIGAFDHPDDERANGCGADATISKPFESQQLIDRVKELLELGRTRSATASARPLLVESAAETLWGDLSSFDTMAPPAAAPAWESAAASTEPFAFPAGETPFSFAESAPVDEPFSFAQSALPGDPFSFAELDEIEETFALEEADAVEETFAIEEPGTFEEAFAILEPELLEEPAVDPFAAPVAPVAPVVPAAAFEEDIIEATLEDDLWGAFETEPTRAAAAVSPVVDTALESETEFEAEEFFSFEDEAELIEETGPALAAGIQEELMAEPSQQAPGFSGEEPCGPTSHLEPLILCEYEGLSFEPEAVEITPQETIETVEEEEPEAVAAPDFVAAVCEGAEAKARAVAPAISEEALVAALATISREVIERIVWEVVPDLAERLIVEEIRKLKAGIRG